MIALKKMKNNYLIDLKKIFISPDSLLLSNDKKIIIKYLVFTQITITIIQAILFGICHRLNIFEEHKAMTVTFLKIVIIGPIIEELIFRSILVKSRLNIVLCVGALLYFFRDSVIHPAGIILIIIVVFTITILRNRKLFIKKSYDKRQLLILTYIASFMFGLGHLINYNISLIAIPYLFVVFLTKSISGFLFSMFRLKFGLGYSILAHLLTNFLLYLIYIFS